MLWAARDRSETSFLSAYFIDGTLSITLSRCSCLLTNVHRLEGDEVDQGRTLFLCLLNSSNYPFCHLQNEFVNAGTNSTQAQRGHIWIWYSLLEHMQSLFWEGAHIGQAYHYNIIQSLFLMCDWVALKGIANPPYIGIHVNQQKTWLTVNIDCLLDQYSPKRNVTNHYVVLK